MFFISSNVSQELGETIQAMVSNCNIILSKTPRQPPPGVIRTHRGIESSFNPSSLGGQLFQGPPQVDTVTNISSNLANINLSGGPASSSAFNLPGALGPLVSTPGSPSRIMTQSQSPFPMVFPLATQMQQHSGAVGTQVTPAAAAAAANSFASSVNSAASATIGGLNRSGPQSGLDKNKLGKFYIKIV